jgi:hypothetical protein
MAGIIHDWQRDSDARRSPTGKVYNIGGNMDSVTLCESCAKNESCFKAVKGICKDYERDSRISHSGIFSKGQPYVYTRQKAHGPQKGK